MRFQVNQVMDAIEQRLTTDVTGAQAVMDLGHAVRLVDLDGGRPVNLVRIGMVVDALSRYLLDGGALLYGVVERALLSEGAFTSKERMVLSRWADDGLIEATAGRGGDRAIEIAQLTGLPLIVPGPDPAQDDRYARLGADPARLLRLVPRTGAAALIPWDGVTKVVAGGDAASAIGRAKVPIRDESTETPEGQTPEGQTPEDPAPDDDSAAAGGTAVQTGSPAAESANTESAKTESANTESGDTASGDTASGEAASGTAEPAAAGSPRPALPLPVEAFTSHGRTTPGRVRVSRYRYHLPPPDERYAAVVSRQWRCDGFECPAFGEHRRIGQPVPRMRGEVPVCPRHGEPVTDAGPRPPAYAVSIVVDDLPRQRLVVRGGTPVRVGRSDDPDVTSVARWLHRAAAQWISDVHLTIEARADGLFVTDLSANGTVLWQRTGPDDPGITRSLHRESCALGDWDRVELYTGIELARGDRRLISTTGGVEPLSVLVDAPTAAHRQLNS